MTPSVASTEEKYSDTEFIRKQATHLKFMATSNGGRVDRMITCSGPDLTSSRKFIVEKRTRISSKWKACANYVIYATSQSGQQNITMRLMLYSGLVLWVRDGEGRYLGSVRVEKDTRRFSILDAVGRPFVAIDADWPKKALASGKCVNTGGHAGTLSYRCLKTDMVFASCRLFHTDLKPSFKSIRVITLDFRPINSLTVDADSARCLLCLASLILLETALK